MLRAVHSITGLAINASDGKIGTLKSLHFDDRTWKVRYLVLKLGNLLDTKDVLVLAAEANKLSWIDQCIKVNLTKEQIKNALPFDKDLPISYQKEWIKQKNFETLYMIDPWSGSLLPMWFPNTEHLDLLIDDIVHTHLRTTEVVDDYKVLSNEGKKTIGKIKDFIIDDEDWIIKYLVIDTNGILPEGDVLVSTSHITGFDCEAKQITVNLDQDEIKNCPKYDPHEAINKDYVLEHYDFEGRLIKRSDENIDMGLGLSY